MPVFRKNIQKLPWQLKAFLLVAAFSLLACQAVTGVPEARVPESEPPASPVDESPTASPNPLELPDSDNQIEACLGDEIYHADENLCYTEDGSAIPLFIEMMSGDVAEGDENLLDEEYTLVVYEVDGNRISSPDFEDVADDLRVYQEDEQKHFAIWAYFAGIIPPENRENVTQYVITTDGLGGSLAAVAQSSDDPFEWALEVDIVDTSNIQELTFTLIHEYGHLLTLNAEQAPPNVEIFNNPDDDDLYAQAEYSCPTYFPGEGCMTDSAYLYQFYTQFWAGIYDEWLDIQSIEDDDEYYEALDDFYFAREDEFVTDYAVTNPEEDIAESWAFFITQPKPAGNNIAGKKVLFFYQFPELVVLREEIIARTYSRLIRMQP